jgi:hypothetical protein
MNTDKIIDRIRKLQGLAASTNAHEAAQAAGEAQRLMTAHRISEAQIASERKTADKPVTDVDVLAATGMKTPQSWIVRLASGVARANGCQITIRASHRHGPAGEIRMFGRKSDLDAATYLFHSMRNEVNRLADAWTDANPGMGRGATIAFKYGAAIEIGERMKQEATAATDALKAAVDLGHAQAPGALMVINRAKAAVSAAVRASVGGRRATWQGSGASNREAFERGREAGAGVRLGNRGALMAPRAKISGPL